MAKKRTFISFDYDHDARLKDLLVGQARNNDSPFDITDMSIKEASANWKTNARTRIKGCDVVVVLCGEHTDTAIGVSTEIQIAQDEGISYFLLKGYADKSCKWPKSSKDSDSMYKWTWDNVKLLMNGTR